MREELEQPDGNIHQPLRLKIMAALRGLPPKDSALDFTRLRALTGATDGNLGAHLASLERAGYIEILKDFHNRKPRTRARMSAQGRRAFAAYVEYLQELIS